MRKSPSQPAIVSGKHYEWQLSDGQQWLSIDHDEVIETHYCQPGAKGMSISTPDFGQVHLDFDEMETGQRAMGVRRLKFLGPLQVEDMGWYFRDDRLWCEYGSQGGAQSASSVSSTDLEQQFRLQPQGSFSFTVGSTRYTLNFSAMIQTNHSTGAARNVRRRPKFNSVIPTPASFSAAVPSPQPAATAVDQHTWEFMGEEGKWTEYQAHICSFDSNAIERHYQQDPQGQLHMKTKKFAYTLDFSGMCQINDSLGTRRAVRRTAGSQQRASVGPQWQFQDADGTWANYSKGKAQSSVSSLDLEIQYQQNPGGTVTFATKYFSYELDFSAMTQRNTSTNTTRRVQRLS